MINILILQTNLARERVGLLHMELISGLDGKCIKGKPIGPSMNWATIIYGPQ